MDDAMLAVLKQWTELLSLDFESGTGACKVGVVVHLNCFGWSYCVCAAPERCRCDAIPPQDGRPNFVPQRLHVWGALDLALTILDPAACMHVVQELPALVPIVLSHACTSQHGVGSGLSAPGKRFETIQWRALSCLDHLIRKLDYKVSRYCYCIAVSQSCYQFGRFEWHFLSRSSVPGFPVRSHLLDLHCCEMNGS